VNLSAWQWTLLAIGAFFAGLSKTGLPGLGILTVALFANAVPARQSTGALLPLLLCGDVFALIFYRKHASWPHLWKLFPSVIAGVISGALAMNRVNNSQVQKLIGLILLAMVGLHLWRQRQGEKLSSELPHAWWFIGLTGFLAGFTTMLANAAGPVMILYLLAAGLPKLVFIGTGAWFFMLVNAFKVPFSLKLGLISSESLILDARLLGALIPGALAGPWLLQRINQRWFEILALALTVIAAVRLLAF
jgi:uncharacterized protein